MSHRSILGLVRRHYYLHKSSWPRVLDLVYWPLMNLFLWGFLAMYLEKMGPRVPQVVAVLLGALLLWDVLFRSHIGVALTFLEEVWSRNVVNLFVSPITVFEFMGAQLVVAALRTVVALSAMTLLAYLLYHFNFFALGLPLVGFFGNLMIMGWSIGLLVSGLILRFGQGAENLAWAIIFLFQPFSAVFYPVSVLPHWLQPIAWATPAACVFEGMRAVITQGRFDADLFLRALLLNVLYLAAGAGAFLLMFRQARRDGLLLQIGE
jgi:ABC-2 type transport system permease protein